MKDRTIIFPAVAFVVVGWIALLDLSFVGDDESSSLLWIGLQQQQKSRNLVSRYPTLNCDAFLDDARRASPTVVDPNNGTLFAAYMTNYHPPFWVSNPQQDRATIRTGWYSEDVNNHTGRLLQILKKEDSDKPLIFVQPQDWGWYPLLGASQRHAVTVVVSEPLAHTTVRLCEALRLNQWTKNTEKQQPHQPVSPFQIFHQQTIEQLVQEWAAQQPAIDKGATGALLLKIEGPGIPSILQHVLAQNQKFLVDYIWLEWDKTMQNTPDTNGENDVLQQITSQLSQHNLYYPWWPIVDDNKLLSKQVHEKCSTSCSLWWKRRIDR